jgi:hypothetical protein
MTTTETETRTAALPSVRSEPLLCGSDQFNEELYDEVCRLRCVARQRGGEVMYLTAADELVKLRNEVTRLNTHNAQGHVLTRSEAEGQ